MGASDRLGLVLTLTLAVTLAQGSVAWAGSRCQIAPAAEAQLRLDLWGRELAGATGTVAAHSTRRVAWVADRQGVVLEALFLVTVQEARNPARLGASVNRPQWVRCAQTETGPWR